MINRNKNEDLTIDFHADYMQVTQHWCEKSEDYAGADALMTALSDGWEAQPLVEYEDRQFGETRTVRLYHIHLTRDGDEDIVMPVLHNPYINRLIKNRNMRLIPRKSASLAH